MRGILPSVAEIPFPPPVLAEAMRDATILTEEWGTAFPDPPKAGWLDDLNGWLKDQPITPDYARTSRAMKKLHETHPRSYEVLYRAIVVGERFEETTKWLNDRAKRNRIPLPAGSTEHYRIKDTVALFIAGLSFVRSHS